MVLNTLTVGAAVTPTVIKTYGSHYLGDRKQRRQKPTAHISYDEGLHLIRTFLQYASHHTVEEIQAFTSQWVPSPRWVRTEDVKIPKEAMSKAADAVIAQLGPRGIEQVGGKTWWQWRRNDRELHAEWVEMRSEHNRRKRAKEDCKRVMLYVHGGAYFFGSVDEHRYQMQRHARKLKARVFAPRYRLAPQYPFPCGLFDCLAAYLHLLTMQDPSTIVLAGDSAGGGMVVSLLVILRDQGIPLPAGAILISPWVDLTHSFPSVAGTNELDYIPAHGFLHRPSASWPPPNSDDLKEISSQAEKGASSKASREPTPRKEGDGTQGAALGFSTKPVTNSQDDSSKQNESQEATNSIPGASHALSIEIDGQIVEIKDQIQMYTTNELIGHPLVSPALQPTLGGLPPMLIQVGGGEMLRDEQIYLAHKAANPTKYPAPAAISKDYPGDIIHKFKPTDVQLQVWDDLCHVAPTLSFTRPAKYMFRSIAQFGAWALARAQRTEIEILDDDALSVISTGSDTGSDADDASTKGENTTTAAQGEVGTAGDPLPPFKSHMIRQRVDRHGAVFPLDESLPGLDLERDEIGIIKAGPVRKWMVSKKVWDEKFAKEKLRVQRQRAKEMAKGYRTFGEHEVPPPSALAGRIGSTMPKEQVKKRSWGMSLWSLWGSSHDEKALVREEQTKQSGAAATPRGGSKSASKGRDQSISRSRSRVRDLGQTGPDESSPIEAANVLASGDTLDRATLSPDFVPTQKMAKDPVTDGKGQETIQKEVEEDPGEMVAEAVAEDQATRNGPLLVLPGTNVTLDGPEAMRPKADARIAFPFKLGRKLSHDANASMVTLESRNIATPTTEMNEKAELAELEVGSAKSEEPKSTGDTEINEKQPERPQPERFETAQEIL